MSRLRSVVAGAVGGLAGAALMGPLHIMLMKIGEPQVQPGEDATEKVASTVARQVTGRELHGSQKATGGQIVHYVFGMTMGALYGLFADSYPLVTKGAGTAFGAAVYVAAHLVTVPLLGLAPSARENGAAQEGSELAAHLAYGAVAERVRRAIA